MEPTMTIEAQKWAAAKFFSLREKHWTASGVYYRQGRVKICSPFKSLAPRWVETRSDRGIVMKVHCNPPFWFEILPNVVDEPHAPKTK